MIRLEVRGQLNTVTTVPSQLVVLSPPAIERGPARAVVKAPGVAVFNVSVVCTGPFTYQWFEDGRPVGEGVASIAR